MKLAAWKLAIECLTIVINNKEIVIQTISIALFQVLVIYCKIIAVFA